MKTKHEQRMDAKVHGRKPGGKGEFPVIAATKTLMVVLMVLSSGVLGLGKQLSSEIVPVNADYAHWMEQARSEYAAGHFLAAEKLYTAAMQTLDRTDQRKRAIALTELGDVYVNKDELSRAESAYKESLQIFKRLSDKTPTVMVLRNLGATYSLAHRDEEALTALQEALKMTLREKDVNPVLSAEVLNCLGIVYYRMGNYRKAEVLLRQAMEKASILGILVDRADLLNNLGAVYHAKRDYIRAETFFKEALRITEGRFGELHPNLTFTLMSLGALYTNAGRYAEAEEQFRRALMILEPDRLSFETRIARVLHALSGMYTKANRNAEAEAALAEAAIIARLNLNKHVGMSDIVEAYSAVLKKHGHTKEADELRTEARRARVAAGLVINAHNPF